MHCCHLQNCKLYFHLESISTIGITDTTVVTSEMASTERTPMTTESLDGTPMSTDGTKLTTETTDGSATEARLTTEMTDGSATEASLMTSVDPSETLVTSYTDILTDFTHVSSNATTTVYSPEKNTDDSFTTSADGTSTITYRSNSTTIMTNSTDLKLMTSNTHTTKASTEPLSASVQTPSNTEPQSPTPAYPKETYPDIEGTCICFIHFIHYMNDCYLLRNAAHRETDDSSFGVAMST